MQRALSAKNFSAARPLIGAYPKIFIQALTISPGRVALVSILTAFMAGVAANVMAFNRRQLPHVAALRQA